MADPALLSRDVVAGMASLAELRTTMAGSADVLAETVRGQPTALHLRRVVTATAALRQASDEASRVIAVVGAVAANISPSAASLDNAADAVHNRINELDRLTAGLAFTRNDTHWSSGSSLSPAPRRANVAGPSCNAASARARADMCSLIPFAPARSPTLASPPHATPTAPGRALGVVSGFEAAVVAGLVHRRW